MLEFSPSIDKLKLRLRPAFRKVTYGHLAGEKANIRYLVEWLRNQSEVCVRKEWDVPHHSCRNACMHHIVLGLTSDRDASFYIGYDYVTLDTRLHSDVVYVEYNPNKSSRLWYLFCSHVETFRTIDVVSFDLAFDFPNLDRNFVGYRGSCDTMTYGTTNNSTLYIAPRTHESGRVKVYQKDIERSSKNVAMTKTLRIEISCKQSYDCALLVRRLNSLYYFHKTEQLELCDDPFLYLLLSAPPWDVDRALSLCASQKRAKYRKLLAQAGYDTPLFCLEDTTLATLIDALLAPLLVCV